MKVILAFKRNAKGIGSSLIRWFTKSDYSHVEMIIGDKWISSNAKGGVHIFDLEPLHEDWDYVEVRVDKKEHEHVMKFIEDQKNAKYDFTGIVFCQLFKITRWENNKKWFCSEFCAQILKEFKVPKMQNINTANLSPKDLYYLFI